MKVKATRTGFYGERLRFEGDVFTIDGKNQLGSWMEQIRKKPGPKSKPMIEKEEVEETPNIAE